MEFLNVQSRQEILAERVLTDKQTAVDYDRKRQSNREALATLRRRSSRSDSGGQKVWLNSGDLFIKLDASTAIAVIEKDQKYLDTEIDRVRDSMKTSIKELEVTQGGTGQKAKQFDLKAI